MNAKHNEFLYSKIFNKKEIEYDSMMNPKYKCILKLINNGSNEILDIGCGNGRLGELILKINNKARITGIDISMSVLRKARKKGLKVIKQDVDGKRLLVKDKSFDLIILTDVLEHVCYNHKLLKEVNRALKDDGSIIVSVPNVSAWYSRFLTLIGYIPCYLESTEADIQATPFAEESIGHIRAFNKKAIIKLLNHSGFKVDKVMGTHIDWRHNFTQADIKLNKNLIKAFNSFDKLISKNPNFASTIIVKASKMIN